MLSAVLILRYPVHILLCAVLTAAVVTEQTKETVGIAGYQVRFFVAGESKEKAAVSQDGDALTAYAPERVGENYRNMTSIAVHFRVEKSDVLCEQ